MLRTFVAREILSGVCLLVVLLLPLTARAEEIIAEEIIAMLDLKFIEDTGKPAGFLCLGEEDDDCVQWSSLYLFEARVRKVIKGELPRKAFRLVGGRHAMMKKDFRGVVALLRKLEAANPAEPQYQIEQWGSRMELYCFARSAEERKPTNIDVDLEGVSLGCYSL